MIKKKRNPGVVVDGLPHPPTPSVDEVDEKIAVLHRGAPPRVVSFELSFGLNGMGINLYKSKDTVEISQTDLISVFGA